MTDYLLDTNIVSLLSPAQRGVPANRQAIAWLRVNARQAHLSVLTILEIESGIRQLTRAGSTRKALQLEVWLAELVERSSARLLSVDERIARMAGQLDALGKARGRHPGVAEVLIAATAIVRGLTVVTRNRRHFAMLDVEALDPFQPLEADP